MIIQIHDTTLSRSIYTIRALRAFYRSPIDLDNKLNHYESAYYRIKDTDHKLKDFVNILL